MNIQVFFVLKRTERMRFPSSFQFLCLISGVLFWVCDGFASKEVSALTIFKEAIHEDPQLILSNWNALDKDPRNWSGISCSVTRDHVIKINISGASLKGFLVPELGNIIFLRHLILHGNKLFGTIPKELGLLKYLKVLDLGMNVLIGLIPPEIGNLTNVEKINLQSNGLTGRLPLELGNLRYLEELRLDSNRLQGTVPAGGNVDFTSSMHGMYASNANLTGFCRSTQLKVADFSYNFFVGHIPKCLEYLPKSHFQGNCLQNEVKQQSAKQCVHGASLPKSHPGGNQKHRPAYQTKHHHDTSQPAWLTGLEVGTAIMVGCLFIVALLTVFHKCNSKSSIIIPWKKSPSEKDNITVYIDTVPLKDVVRYGRQELEVACEDFSNIIGSSPDGLVYKGTMNGGSEIAVISLCIKEEHWTDYLELYFQREVADLARLHHENMGKLLGYCRESSPFTRMLVFEYASNGTMYEHLHYGEGCQVSWTRRMKIVLGIARGLKYLHAELEPPFTISELNSSAVYLTDDFSPKLVDLESWKRILKMSEKYSSSIGSQGPLFVLPNSLEARHLDIQGNVHAFGVLLLEIISGRPPYCKDKEDLVNWAKEYLELPEVMPYIVDPELKHFRYEDLKVICEVVNLCINSDPNKRPSIREVYAVLESKIETTVSVELRSSSLAWAELALST